MSKDKRFIVRKYVNAPTAADAIQRESSQPADEVYLDNPEHTKSTADGIGFHAHQEPTWRSDEIIARRRK